jgi:hypothetical protein
MSSPVARSSMICPAKTQPRPLVRFGLGAVYVPPDKNSEFEAISYAWKMSGAIGKNPEFHACGLRRSRRGIPR